MKGKIVSCGGYLPEKKLTNQDITKMVETSDEWIRTRTGIIQRFIMAENQTVSDMALEASLIALKNIEGEVDGIIFGTSTQDLSFPSSACILQGKLNETGKIIAKGFAFDIIAACAGFVYGVTLANSMIKTGIAKRILVVGADAVSRAIDWNDRNTCVLFGDGAGAVVKAVFKHAIVKMSSSIETLLKESNITKDDIQFIIPHQANLRILEGVAHRLEMPQEKFIATVDKHANTSAASIPLALYEALKEGKIKKNDLIVFEAIGGGLAWGGVLLRW